MTTSTTAAKGKRRARQVPDIAGWLGLAASPTFAVMTWFTVANTPPSMMGASPSGGLPIGGMSWMYILMCLFHLSPWLKLAAARSRQSTTRPATPVEGN